MLKKFSIETDTLCIEVDEKIEKSELSGTMIQANINDLESPEFQSKATSFLIDLLNSKKISEEDVSIVANLFK